MSKLRANEMPTDWRACHPIFVLLALLSLLAFFNMFFNGFAFDDKSIVVENRLIKNLRYLPTLFMTDYWAGPRLDSLAGPPVNLYRPLVLVTFALNYAVGGLNTSGYHLVNLLLHFGAAFALYSLARQVGLSWGGALAASTLFVVHPLHTEAVTGIVGRAELLMTLGVFLTLHWYIRGKALERLQFRFALASWAAFAAALLSKEQALMLPALLALHDVSERKGPGTWKALIQHGWRRYLGYLLLLGLYLILRILILGRFFDSLTTSSLLDIENPLAHVSWSIRVLTALKVAGKYLWLFMWPEKLAADYSFNAIPLSTSFLEPAVLGALTAWGGLVGLAVYTYRRGPRPAFFAIGLTAITFLPASNLLIPVGTIMGERLFYLPSAGLCLLIGVAWDQMVASVQTVGALRPLTRVSIGVFAIVLALLTTRTILRNEDWQNTEVLMESTIRVVPQSAKAHYVLGHSKQERLEVDDAIREYEEAIRIFPWYDFAYQDLGMVYGMKERWHEAEAAYQQALTIREQALGPAHPSVAVMLNKLGLLYAAQGNYAQAEPLYQRALAILEQALGPAHPSVVVILNNLGILYAAQGNYAQAEPLYRRALAIYERTSGHDHPDVALIRKNYATLLRKTNRIAE